jgi:PAS domain S-box-containing protein
LPVSQPLRGAAREKCVGVPEANRRMTRHLDGKAKPRFRGMDLSALLRLAETATRSLDPGKILNDTLDESLNFLGFDVGFIRTVDGEKSGMVVRAARGLRSPEFLEGVTPLTGSRRNVSRIVFETKEPYVCADIRRNPVYTNRTMEREGVVSTAAAPILSKNRVLGIIVVGSRKAHRFTSREIRLLTALGAQLGAALENAELYYELARDKAYIENLVENAGDAIVSTDTGDRVLTWNRAAEVIFGYSKDEATGSSFNIVMPPERSRELEEIRLKLEVTGPMRNLETRRRRKDGTVFDVALAVSPLKDEGGRVIGFLHIVKDITEKNRYERRLKELDRMKSDFVSSVSHELRTPLTAIKGSVDNMVDGILGPVTEKQARYLARINANADRLARLISDLLDLSKIEAGRIELKPAVVEVSSIINEVADSLRGIAADKLIRIENNGAEPIQVWADRDKVIQILTNLIGNAVKFTPPHGRVAIAAHEREDGWVKIAVEDNGPGIPADEAGKIFDKFYQAQQPNKVNVKGTGLGLAISKSLVELHGGSIGYQRGTDGGSVFSFTLPARRPLN